MAALTQILLNAQDPMNEALRVRALAQIEEAEKANAQDYVGSLMAELSNESSPQASRQLAGTLLKNFMSSRDAATRQEKAQKWLAIPAEVRSQIKKMTLATLQSPEKLARMPASTVAVTIASIEMPEGEWPDFIPTLCQAAGQKENPHAREAGLVCLGYVCEDCPSQKALLEHSDKIVTVIVQGMVKEEPNQDIRMEATKALCNSFEFLGGVMDRETQRSYLMRVICEAATLNIQPVANVQTREYAMQCLVKLVELYYSKLEDYVRALFMLTLEAVEKDEQSVGLQGLEFWATMCETEQYLIDNEGELGADMKCKYYVKGATKFLVPIIWKCLLKQDEDAGFDDYDICYAAAHLLQSMALTIGDEIVEHIMPLVNTNIQSANWREIEASLHAFGSILDGPSETGPIASQVQTAVVPLLALMKHQRPIVKHTATWCVGRIAAFHCNVVIQGFMDKVLEHMVEAMQDANPEVATYACYTIHNVAIGCGDPLSNDPEPTNPLSRFFLHLAQPLYSLATTTQHSNLRTEAWSALTNCVWYSAADCTQHLLHLLPNFLLFLENFNQQAAMAQGEEQLRQAYAMQEMMCALLQTIVRKFRYDRLRHEIMPYADRIMNCLLKILENPQSSVESEALMVVGGMAEALGNDFDKYVTAIFPAILRGLRNCQAASVCKIAINTLGEVLTCIPPEALNAVMFALLENLKSQELDNSIKPMIIMTFGDIALQIGERFCDFLPQVMNVVACASELVKTEVNRQQDNEELVAYQNELREQICSCYTGIIVGLKSSKPKEVQAYLRQVVNEIHSVAEDMQTIPDTCLLAALSLICDVFDAYGQPAKDVMAGSQQIVAMVQAATQHSDPDVKEAALAIHSK